jgi:hypothetical protein
VSACPSLQRLNPSFTCLSVLVHADFHNDDRSLLQAVGG